MDFIIDAIVEWLKGLLVDGIMEKTPAFQSAGVVPTCVAISPTL